MKVKATEIQTLILSKETFRSLDAAKRWVRDHDFKVSHEGKPPDETSTSYRFRQRSPGDFVAGSMRTISITDGVKAVIGTPKTTKAEGDLLDFFLDTLEELQDG